MFTHFTLAEKEVHDPSDKRVFVAISRYILVIFGIILVGSVGIAWLQYLLAGLPADPATLTLLSTATDPKGFPVWLRFSHWINFFFLSIIIRSGISILFDHPRMYWNAGCAPGTEWIRFTPIKVPDDKIWTANEDTRYISPVIALPGYRHTVGIARVWHFLTVPFFVLNGTAFIVFLFCTNQWKRLVPAS